MLLPDTNLLAERKLFGNLKSIKSLKQSGISGAFTGQAVSKQAVLLKLILVKLGMTRSDTQDQYWSHIDMTWKSGIEPSLGKTKAERLLSTCHMSPVE